jgi:DNA-binding FadR family transcriptional regulator
MVSISKHEEIADALARDVLSGQYRTGERLPSERDLATRFQANRGAVREAMKKLEQLGLADIQPGGARVAPLEEASLDVIGHLLALGEVPERKLVNQILDVIGSLVETAAVNAVNDADDEELERLRMLTRPLYLEDLDQEAHLEARMLLMSNIMRASNNLVVQLIARTLLMQFVPQMAELRRYGQIDLDAHRDIARALDIAMGKRDLLAVRATIQRLSQFNRAQTDRTFEEYEQARRMGAVEVAAS